VRSNIAYGRPDATDAEVVAAARAAEAHEFISALPLGYDTVVGERGLLLSGGQRQRVTLARALLTDPRILLLDDATSAIDSRVEEEIHATLRRIMVGRSTILVAHRRSTLRLAQRIVVLDEGRVVDAGTHEELMERSRLYRDLLAGPGDDAERDVEPEHDRSVATTNAWQRSDGLEVGGRRVNLEQISALASTRLVPTRIPVGGGGGGGNAARLSAPPTEKLLRQIEALPPPRDVPDIDVERETRLDPRPFRFATYLRPYWPQLLLGALFVFLDAMAGLVGPSLSGGAISHGIQLHREVVLWTLAAIYLGVQLSDWLFMWGETFLTGRTSERLLYAIRAKIFAHLQRLGVDFYDREMTGRVLTRMTSDVDTLSQLLQSGLVNALVNGVSFFGVAVILCVLNLHLALIVLCVIPPLVVATVVYQRKSRRAYDRQRDRIAAVNADLEENVSGVRVTQAFRRESRNTANFLGLARGYRDAGVRSQWLQAIYFSFAELAGNVGILLVLGIGSNIVFRAHGSTGRAVAVGVLAAFLLYLTQLFAPVQQLSQVFDTYQQASAGLRRITGLLNTPISTPVPLVPAPIGRIRGEVRFVGLHFAYPGTTTEALSGVDLVIRPGETVALVGETGAGKSTVVKLVARFYDPTAGRVLIDGIPLTELDLPSYRRQLGYVPQEPFLFAGTIRDNIAYGRFDATDAEVEAAARAVGAHDVIVEAGGYWKYVSSRGRSLSIGQRQLLCLARALLVDPAILLLDEATSNLDLSTEARVNRAMGIVAHGRTAIIIAHRLQTAQRADRILVVDRGRIVEAGAHDDLVAAGGRYAAMWASFDVGETPAA
jgi:ATP-binding cassette subfamily B protein